MKKKQTKATQKVFDENGHRVARNKETTHRLRPKVIQINPNEFRLNFMFPLEDIAKLRQYVRGKEVPAKATEKRAVRKPTRDMSVGYLLREYVKVLTKDVILDEQSLKWIEDQRKMKTALRARQDAMIAAGVNRIPKDQQLKRGLGSENYKKG